MQSAFDPTGLTNSALLLVDMNRSHLDHSIGHMLVAKPDADRIIANAVKLREAWAKAGLPVIFVRTHHRQDPRDGNIVDNKSPFWMAQHGAVVPGLGKPRKSLAVEGAPVTEIVAELAPRPGDFTVFKHRYSPFDNTDLEHLLRNLGVKSLVIGGVNTNNCVMCACFEAFNRDYRVVLAEDLCASMNGPDYHEAAVKLIGAALGWVVQSGEIIQACRPATAGGVHAQEMETH
ncbi:cysteine hydrolase [Tardiphaga sp. vice352]|uniref:cysteine hydrolase family protein n=1 Tax=unclassified Tardiphaga TaxID=2631404 RepID=UPI001163894F|nr:MULTISPECIES: cysteine hydrolase [unclassified Tardiphaga]QDM14746.1 cysteine hydrolase [Tardiphaga sp. vice278]QDM24925.1 cysteine hydrolase [Tardiphaga sp. vice304]QDM30135.1 cysteine hydrolase [Tardiphaga sp. vice352]